MSQFLNVKSLLSAFTFSAILFPLSRPNSSTACLRRSSPSSGPNLFITCLATVENN